MKLISLSIFIGLALIAGSIHYKPADPALACGARGSCSFIKGKYMIELSHGQIINYNTENGEYTEIRMKQVRR